MENEEHTQVLSRDGEATRVTPSTKVPTPPRLLFLTGPRQGTEVLLSSFPFTIGRSPRNHLVIPMDTVSAFHARILKEGEHFYLEDLKSKNGTYVGDQRIQERYELKGGEEIIMGEARLRFYPYGSSFDLSSPRREEEDTATGVHKLPKVSSAPLPRKRLLLRWSFIVATGAVVLLLWLDPRSFLIWEARNPVPQPVSPGGSAPLPATQPRSEVADLPSGGELARGFAPSPLSAVTATSPVAPPQGASQGEALPVEPEGKQREPLPIETGEKNKTIPPFLPEKRGKGSPKSELRILPSPRGSEEKPEPHPPSLEILKKDFERLFLSGDEEGMKGVIARCLEGCDPFRQDLLVVVEPALDLPRLIQQARAVSSLARQGWLTPPMLSHWSEYALKRTDALLLPLIQQGDHQRIRKILEQLHQAGADFLSATQAYQALHEKGESLFHAGYSLERVNPQEARAKYEEALRLLPPGDPLKERIERRLDALR